MSASLGQFGEVYVSQVDGNWQKLPGFVIKVGASDYLVACIVELEADVNQSQEPIQLYRCSYSATPPSSGERIFVPAV
jgi:hypothetical protein